MNGNSMNSKNKILKIKKEKKCMGKNANWQRENRATAGESVRACGKSSKTVVKALTIKTSCIFSS